MDFDLIEGLTSKDILELYDEKVIIGAQIVSGVFCVKNGKISSLDAVLSMNWQTGRIYGVYIDNYGTYGSYASQACKNAGFDYGCYTIENNLCLPICEYEDCN